ncbi:MAG TPA: hypothetical protein VH092_32665 [Urbifossiella sp.]|nr:hypothetical protein [Urbifossiella sp.]
MARKVRPDFAKRTSRGEEAHISIHIGMIAIGWFPSLVIFGTLASIIGRAVGGEPGGVAGLIAGAIVIPVVSLRAAIAGSREVRLRKALYSKGQLLAGWATGRAAADHYVYAATHPDAVAERTGAHVVALSFCFETPAGQHLCGNAQAIHDKLPLLPDRDTPVVVLYHNDDHYEVL